MINLANTRFDYEPFPIGYASPVIGRDLYCDLVKDWPSTELFQFKPNLGKKYSLSEVNNRAQYIDFLKRSKVWRELYEFVKNPRFVEHVVEVLEGNEIDLGLRDRHASRIHVFSSSKDRLGALLAKIGRRNGKPPISTRFEFSMMPAAGGFIKPHTDAPQKLITLVVSMINCDEWNDSWGGGTATLRPRDARKTFNHMNKQFEFDDVVPIKTFPFAGNQCVTFIKTFNSFHAVYPTMGPADGPMRRTLTINIESWGN